MKMLTRREAARKKTMTSEGCDDPSREDGPTGAQTRAWAAHHGTRCGRRWQRANRNDDSHSQRKSAGVGRAAQFAQGVQLGADDLAAGECRQHLEGSGRCGGGGDDCGILARRQRGNDSAAEEGCRWATNQAHLVVYVKFFFTLVLLVLFLIVF